LEVLPGPHRFSVEVEWQETFTGVSHYEVRERVTPFKKVTRSDKGTVEFTAEVGHVYNIRCYWKGIPVKQIDYYNAEMFGRGSCEWVVNDYTTGVRLVPDRGEINKDMADWWLEKWMARQKQAPGDAQSAAAAQRTPLHDAAQKGTKEQVEPLLAEGADANAQAEDSVTPSHTAATRQKTAVAPGSASAQDVSPTSSDASRLQDILLEWNFHANVCLHDVNGDRVEDFLVVHNAGVGPNVIPAPPPGTTAEGAKMWQQGLVKVQFTMAALDGVLDKEKKAQDWQVDLMYLRVFDRLYEFLLSEYADCSGNLKDYDYRLCLMRGFENREQTDEYPTLPGCP